MIIFKDKINKGINNDRSETKFRKQLSNEIF